LLRTHEKPGLRDRAQGWRRHSDSVRSRCGSGSFIGIDTDPAWRRHADAGEATSCAGTAELSSCSLPRDDPAAAPEPAPGSLPECTAPADGGAPSGRARSAHRDRGGARSVQPRVRSRRREGSWHNQCGERSAHLWVLVNEG
jgi:hypothetical protein